MMTTVATGLAMFGIGQGALVTLLFDVLVTSSPKELSADVAALRGTANNLAASVGTTVIGALEVGILSAGVMSALTVNPDYMPGEVPDDGLQGSGGKKPL
jgi:hypothetical protein